MDSLDGKICWRRDRLPTPVFLGFLCGSAGKEFVGNAGDLGLIPGLGRSPGVRERLATPVFWPGEFHGLYSPWGCKELDISEQVSLSLQSISRGWVLFIVLNIISVCVPSFPLF